MAVTPVIGTRHPATLYRVSIYPSFSIPSAHGDTPSRSAMSSTLFQFDTHGPDLPCISIKPFLRQGTQQEHDLSFDDGRYAPWSLLWLLLLLLLLLRVRTTATTS